MHKSPPLNAQSFLWKAALTSATDIKNVGFKDPVPFIDMR